MKLLPKIDSIPLAMEINTFGQDRNYARLRDYLLVESEKHTLVKFKNGQDPVECRTMLQFFDDFQRLFSDARAIIEKARG